MQVQQQVVQEAAQVSYTPLPPLQFVPAQPQQQSGMILRKHTYLKVYKCWRILPILKTPTIK